MLEDTVKKSPGKGRAHYNLGTALSSRGRIDEAIEHFQEAIRLRPASEEYNNLGSAYLAKGLIDQAIEQYRFAITSDAANAEAYYNLGRAYLVSGNRDNDAILMFTKALELKSDYTDASVNLAAVYIKTKSFPDAVQLLESVTARHNDRPDAHFNLGVAYFCLGNVTAADRERYILEGLDPRFAAQLKEYMSQPHPRP